MCFVNSSLTLELKAESVLWIIKWVATFDQPISVYGLNWKLPFVPPTSCWLKVSAEIMKVVDHPILILALHILTFLSWPLSSRSDTKSTLLPKASSTKPWALCILKLHRRFQLFCYLATKQLWYLVIIWKDHRCLVRFRHKDNMVRFKFSQVTHKSTRKGSGNDSWCLVQYQAGHKPSLLGDRDVWPSTQTSYSTSLHFCFWKIFAPHYLFKCLEMTLMALYCRYIKTLCINSQCQEAPSVSTTAVTKHCSWICSAWQLAGLTDTDTCKWREWISCMSELDSVFEEPLKISSVLINWESLQTWRT